MSMAAGEFVPVHAQADTEKTDLARERVELKQHPAGERRELEGFDVGRGLDQPLADQVAGKLMAHNALGAHARDALGLSNTTAARLTQMALTLAFSAAAARVSG